MTHEFKNDSDQAERKAIMRNDTYFARQQNTADDAGGRFTKLTPSTLTGQSQQVPPLPTSSPWAQGFDQGVEPALGFSVDEMPALEEPALSPTTVATSPTTVEVDRAGEGPVIGSTVASFPATDEPVIGSSIKRRGF
jgi:hypothetical protein